MNAEWMLRQARADDLETIMQLETLTFGADAWSSRTMRAEIANEHTHYLVAARRDAESAVGGYAGLLAPRGAKEADVQTIAVAAHARRQGIGSALLAALMSEAAARGATEVFLEVRADNPGAQKLYRSFGFDEIGVRPHYYQPDNVDAVVMLAGIRGPVGRGDEHSTVRGDTV